MSEEKKNIGIRIQEIKELSYSNKLFDELVENFDEERVDIKLGFAVRGDSNKNTISLSIIIHYKYTSENDNKPKEFLKLETDTTFKVFDFTDEDIKYSNENHEIFINDDLMAIFLNTAIGSTRGMLAYKIASLPINIVLPLFDINEILNPKQNIKEGKVKK
jgi:hypothetical protein